VVNYVAISEALGLTLFVLAAGVAADNLISALFSLASNIPAEPKTATASPQKDGERLSVLNGGAAVALSFIICKAGSAMAARLGLQGGTLHGADDRPCAPQARGGGGGRESGQQQAASDSALPRRDPGGGHRRPGQMVDTLRQTAAWAIEE
jgi:hypothetical protein